MKSLPIAILAAGATAALSAAPNPLFTDTFTADPAPIVVDDTCYVITTQDENDGTPGQALRDGKPITGKDGATFDFGLAVYAE